MNQIRRHLTFLMVIAGGGLGLRAQAPTAMKPEATLHIYRPRLDVGKATHPAVSCDSSPVARIQNGRVYTIKISAGTHSFTVGEKTAAIKIDAEPGKEYFLRVDYPPNASFAVGATAVLVGPTQGAKEIKDLRPLDGWYIENANCGKT